MANLNIEPGESSLADMIGATRYGVLMDTNRSWSIDDSRNKFQFGCEYGQLIEDGEIVGTVRNPGYRGISRSFWRSLSGVADAMTRLRAVEQRRWIVRASTSGPSAILDSRGEEVAVSGHLRRAVVRGAVSAEVAALIQTTLDAYESGVNIVRVNFDRADPPREVIDAFRADGIAFAYVTNLVPSDMLVEEEPAPGEPIDVVRQILRPHRLTVRTEAGVHLVVRFDQDGMHAEGVTGNYLGRTVTAAIETVGDRDGHTRVRLEGEADAAYVARHLRNAGLLSSTEPDAMPILSRLQGTAPWAATVDVLERSAAGEAPVVLRVSSSLEGAAVALPAPFGKPPSGRLPLVVEARFADAEHRRMRLSLGSHASGVFDLVADDGGYRLGRGAVASSSRLSRPARRDASPTCPAIHPPWPGTWSAFATAASGSSRSRPST